jgi:CDP-2,3-bis-(O-geranylgeranyl)-sn-glycerol synthase
MQSIVNDILFVLWFFLPAGLANVAPVFATKLPFLRAFNFPLDFCATFRGKRILGDHKTVRGLLSGILIGILTVYLQIYLYEQVPLVRSFVPIDYSSINPILFGFLSAVGALGGDAVKSFFKRQLGIPPGKSWFPFDQVDYVIGGMIVTSFYIRLTLSQYLILFLLWSLMHPVATFIGYLLKLRDRSI